MIYLDFETRSEAELKRVGTYLYAHHPSTEVLCMAYAFGDDPVQLWTPGFEDLSPIQATRKADRERHDIPPSPFPEDLAAAIRAGELIEAHNAFFERCIWTAIMVPRHGMPPVRPEQWRCSASVAASFALRRRLEHVAADLRLSQQKDGEGHRLMLKLSKPRKPTKADPDSTWHQRALELLRLFDYCRQDVETERAVSKALRPLSGDELATWQLDQEINLRGLHLDRPMIEGALKIGAAAEQDAAKQLEQLTDGEVDKATRRSAFKQWLRGEGVTIPTKLAKQIDADGAEELVEKETIDAEHLRGVLAEAGLPEHVERAIKTWLAVNKASTKKYLAMLNRLGDDDRVREVLRYWAASTGRWGGAGIQPQNLPRNCPDPEEMEKVCQDLRTGDYELICLLYGRDEVMPLLSRALRGAITAAPGHRLIVADYSAIEARGTFWVSGHDEGIEAFRKIDSGAWPGHDIYTWQAAKILLREVTKKDKHDRQLWGKVPVLGCGYQMGPPKLVDYAASMGAEITEDQAQKIVYAYRRDHWPVKEFWYEAERCAIEAVRRGNGGDAVSMAGGRIKWAVRGAFLHCRLPSGRLLSYFRPKVEWDKKFGRPKLTFLGHATYKPGLWTRCSTYGGKLTENIVQALCRDIMRDAMLRARAAGYPIVLTVHDEIVTEVPHGQGSLEEFERLLSRAPSWADGFPIAVEGWERGRYGKD